MNVNYELFLSLKWFIYYVYNFVCNWDDHKEDTVIFADFQSTPINKHADWILWRFTKFKILMKYIQRNHNIEKSLLWFGILHE